MNAPFSMVIRNMLNGVGAPDRLAYLADMYNNLVENGIQSPVFPQVVQDFLTMMGAGAATIASAGAAVGIGNVLSSSIHSVAINPSLAKQSFGSKKRASPRKCPFLCRWG